MMNDRIVQLAEQAGWFVDDGDIFADDCFDPVNTNLEKFAELIVRECIKICEDMDGVDNFKTYMHPRTPRYDCALEIKEHFGVE